MKTWIVYINRDGELNAILYSDEGDRALKRDKYEILGYPAAKNKLAAIAYVEEMMR